MEASETELMVMLSIIIMLGIKVSSLQQWESLVWQTASCAHTCDVLYCTSDAYRRAKERALEVTQKS